MSPNRQLLRFLIALSIPNKPRATRLIIDSLRDPGTTSIALRCCLAEQRRKSVHFGALFCAATHPRIF
jgi:hypothetical protein